MTLTGMWVERAEQNVSWENIFASEQVVAVDPRELLSSYDFILEALFYAE